MQARIALSLTVFLVTGCIDSSRVNATCSWLDPSTAPLHLDRAADREHLRIDAQLAGELGQRLADVHFRNRPDLGHPIQQRCTNALNDTIARRHRLSRSVVDDARTYRVWWVDFLSVYLPLALVVGFAMDAVTRRICRSCDPDDRTMAILSVMVFVPVTALLGLAVGQIWGFTVEGWYLRNEHVAFRGFLVPIVRHGWIGGFSLLGLCAATAVARLMVTPLRKVERFYRTMYRRESR